MKQFRDTPYYITKDGKVFRYFPPKVRVSTSTYKGKLYRKEYPVPERYKELKQILRTKNYYVVGIYKSPGVREMIDIHRLVAEVHCDGYFEGAHVDHIDCNKLNNHYTNLQWCTKEYNIKKGSNPNYPLFAQI